jgi:signal transduction histidine kinase
VRKNFLLLLMILVTLPAAALFFVSLHSYRAQEEAMDSMMSSYVHDLAETFSGTGQTGRGPSRHRPMGQMRFRMMSMNPSLKGKEAGGVLYLAPDGQVLAASREAEELLFLVKETPLDEEPRRIMDEEGKAYYAVLRRLEDGNYILAAVSRSVLLGPLTGIWKFWVLAAMIASSAVFVGMVLLWRFLAAPLRRIVEKIPGISWGRDRSPVLYSGPLFELESLSEVIGALAGEAYDKEELKKQYVTDMVRVEEQARSHLARELHDGPLQSSVAAIKRIQLAREVLASGGDKQDCHLDTAEEVVQAAAREIRDYCDELSPSWVRLGLVSALQENADRLSRAYSGLSIDLEADDELDSVSEEAILALVRIFQEAASNSVRHGRAKHLRATLKKEAGQAFFILEDDGEGFDASRLSGTGYEILRTTGHRGLANMHERARLLGGSMTLDSAPGEGCRIEIVFPLSGDDADTRGMKGEMNNEIDE